MGKNLIQQRRGKGTLAFKSPSHNYVGSVRYISWTTECVKGKITDIKNCPAHSAPLLEVSFENGKKSLMIAAEEKRVGDEVQVGYGAEIKQGNVLTLKDVPEGSEIFNVESKPGDGGKFVRAGGNSAKVVSRTKTAVTVILPSKKQKKFNPECRATIGRIAGAGRLEKPLLKAGNAFHKMKARNRFWPIVRGKAMNAVAHPHGGKRTSKGKVIISKRSAPPGAKVGKIAPRRTGKKR